MDIHEYQAKQLLADFGVPIPRGGLAYSPEQAAYRARELGGSRWAVKAQVHSGGRGKAGGILLCDDEHAVSDAADSLLGKRLVTEQTGARGKLVHRLYVESVVPHEQEFYLGFVLDRRLERVVVAASARGGVEIEELAAEDPGAIIRVDVEPAVGMQSFQAREPRTLLISHPVGPRQMEMWRFYLADEDAPDYVKQATRDYFLRYSGPGGMTEQDDMENWSYATEATSGTIARRQDYNYQLSLGKERPVPGLTGAVQSGNYSEGNARIFYRRWAQFMAGRGWDGLMAAAPESEPQAAHGD